MTLQQPSLYDIRDNRGDDLANGIGIRRDALPVREQQVSGPDQRECQRVDIGVGGDAPQLTLVGQVAGEHGARLGQDRDPTGRTGLSQPGAQLVPEYDEPDDRHGDRVEQVHQRGGEVGGDGAGPGGSPQGDGLVLEPGDAVLYEFDEEGIEVGEVPVQDSFGDTRLGGDRPAGQCARSLAQQDTLGGVEQLLARVADVHPGGHCASFHIPMILAEWATAHYGGHMPTISQDRSRPPYREPHEHRRMAESFGVDPERYDRARPRYPDALVERIVDAAPGLDVLDIGCGTGIEARQFQAAGCTVLGVDPDARMAEFARRTGIEVEVSTFEAWDPADRMFDAVVAGQAWHWVDPVEGVAKAARILRPGGRLAVFGHVFDAPTEVTEALTTAYRRAVPDSPLRLPTTGDDRKSMTAMQIYQAMFAKAADGIRQAGGFGEPEQWRFDWEQSYTRDEWLDHLPTTGALTQLPPDKLAEVLDAVGAAIDKIGGGFTLPYTTLTATAARADNA